MPLSWWWFSPGPPHPRHSFPLPKSEPPTPHSQGISSAKEDHHPHTHSGVRPAAFSKWCALEYLLYWFGKSEVKNNIRMCCYFVPDSSSNSWHLCCTNYSLQNIFIYIVYMILKRSMCNRDFIPIFWGKWFRETERLPLVSSRSDPGFRARPFLATEALLGGMQFNFLWKIPSSHFLKVFLSVGFLDPEFPFTAHLFWSMASRNFR